jgi:hypothetical protein
MNKIRFILLILANFSLLFISTYGQSTDRAMTNADLVKMIKAELPENTIILAIQKNTSAFDTSADGLIVLKQAGATARILDAVLQGGNNLETQSSEPAQSSSGLRSEYFVGTWGVYETTDEYKSGSGEIPTSSKIAYLARFHEKAIYQSTSADDKFFVKANIAHNWKYTAINDEAGTYELIYQGRTIAGAV